MKLERKMDRKEWLSWRKDRIGASDISSIMGCHGFFARYEVWARLSNIETELNKKDNIDSVPMLFGRDLEKIALDRFAEENNVEVVRGEIYIHDEITYMHATLDGRYYDEKEKKNIILECKCFSEEKMRELEVGFCPWTVNLQVQAQMMCAGADLAIVISYGATTGKYSFVRVPRDEEICKEISHQARYIYHCARNVIRINDYKYTKIGAYMEIEDAIKGYIATLPTKEEKEREELHSMYADAIKNHVSSTGETISNSGVVAKCIKTKGRINYTGIPELLGVDLEKYRGKDSFRVDIKYSGELK